MDIFGLNKKKDSIALIDDETQLTYEELDLTVNELSKKISKRTLVALVANNTIGSIVVYLACLKADAVILMLEKNVSENHLSFIIESYMPQIIFSAKQLNDTKMVDKCYEMLMQETVHGKIDINNELALLLSTSGSTGSVKFIKISYDNIIANTKSIIDALGVRQCDTVITTLAMNYSYSLSIINTHLSVGAKIILNKSSVITEDFWKKVEKYGVTTFGGVPYTYEMLDKLNLFPKSFSTLRYLTVAGGKLSEKTTLKICNYCKGNGMKFFSMYGQTEATARIFILPWERAFDKLGSAGIPIPGGKAFLVDEHKNIILKPGKLGEIVYSGKNVTMGYALDYEDLGKGDTFNGTIETGDLAIQDDEGFFYIKGRKHHFVKIHGKRISLQDIEKMLTDKEIEAVCLQRNDFIYLFVVSCCEKYENINALMYDIGITKRYYRIIPIEAIPRQHSGKIRYAEFEKKIDIIENINQL